MATTVGSTSGSPSRPLIRRQPDAAQVAFRRARADARRIVSRIWSGPRSLKKVKSTFLHSPMTRTGPSAPTLPPTRSISPQGSGSPSMRSTLAVVRTPAAVELGGGRALEQAVHRTCLRARRRALVRRGVRGEMQPPGDGRHRLHGRAPDQPTDVMPSCLPACRPSSTGVYASQSASAACTSIALCGGDERAGCRRRGTTAPAGTATGPR
jgi:hypothetical protein